MRATLAFAFVLGAFLASAPADAAEPSAAEARALGLLEEEAKAYELGADEFDRGLEMVVRHYYEERRGRALSAMDGAIAIQVRDVENARGEAILRLEEFVARYSGPNADPEATPDSMLRLAALYEERARSDPARDPGPGLALSIAMYRRILDEFPRYAEADAVHYYLGHALIDLGRLDEAQAAWRALVCHNKFRVESDPKSAGKLRVEPLVQDHPERFWAAWYARYSVPKDAQAASRADPRAELVFRDPYAGCEALGSKAAGSDKVRYLAEAWWQLGEFHFDQLDGAAGPYYLNRAVSAYARARELARPPLYGVVLYKLAWAYFKQQRYRAAVDTFVELLVYADEEEAKTGDPGADFRAEAYTYIAGALTYVDLDGPGPHEPFSVRSDVLETETDPALAEQKMRVAIARVEDPALVPQDRKWTPEIYRALAREFQELPQYQNAVLVLEAAQAKFPLHARAPETQATLAQIYDELSRLTTSESAREAYRRKALVARTGLAAYVGRTPWTEANAGDPEALARAGELARQSLKGAASDHTNFARAAYERSRELSDPGSARRALLDALTEYHLAEAAWAAYLEQDAAAIDAYDSEFWLADARYWALSLELSVGRAVAEQDVKQARESILSVLDSNEDDQYVQQAGFYLVTLAEKLVEARHREHAASAGKRGFPARTEVRFEGEGSAKKVARDAMPAEVKAAIRARQQYLAKVPADRDAGDNRTLYAFQIADTYFVYGDFARAWPHFEELRERYCGKNQWGYKAWEKLISMSNFEGNLQESRRLTDGPSCAFDAETALLSENIRRPVKQGFAYLEARKLYEKAEAAAGGRERVEAWRAAAAAYKLALEAAPDRDEAPEAAMNGAYAYKQVGEYDAAVDMYELFIARYGDNKALAELKAKDAPKHAERLKYLKGAYGALAGAYVLFFDYPKAARAFDALSRGKEFDTVARREAALMALNLYSSLGDASGMQRARAELGSLDTSPEDLAEADFVLASAALKSWDAKGPDAGPNRAQREAAERALTEYFKRYRGDARAQRFALRAAHALAKIKLALLSKDAERWFGEVIGLYASLAKSGAATKPAGSPEAALAAEAEYTLLDQQIKQTFDYDTGHHRYRGTAASVLEQFRKDALAAKGWYDKLEAVVRTYVVPEWSVQAVARQGSLYDSLRSGLYYARPPELLLFDAKLEATLRRAEESGNPDLLEKADALRVKVQESWRLRRDQEIAAADRVAVDRYAHAVVLGERYNVAGPAVVRAVRRLAFLADVVGEARMKQYTAGVTGLNYAPGAFQKRRPGLSLLPPPSALAPPAPP